MDAYVVLQTPLIDENALKVYLSRLIIVLEARVVNARQDHDDGPSSSELIFSGSVQEQGVNDPLVVVQQPDEDGTTNGDGYILVIWKLPVRLSRPQRLRPHNPSVTFSATANLRPVEALTTSTVEDEYMESQVPAGQNLLESFSRDPALGAIKPHLSAHRVSRIVPTTKSIKEMMRPLKNVSRRSLNIYPAFSARVRFAKSNSTPNNPAVIASLDISITSHTGSGLTLESVEVKVTEGHVEDLNGLGQLSFPTHCLSRDEMTLLYRLSPSELDITPRNIKPVQITINAKAILSETCQPLINLNWTTSVDFSIPVNPGFTASTTQTASSTSREHNRPSNLSISSTTSEHPDSLPTVEVTTRHQRSSSIPDFGVTMTFTALTPNPITLGTELTWEVFIVNRSSRSRKLALLPLPSRRRPMSATTTNRPPSSHSTHQVDTKNFAEAVTDENVLYALQRNAAVDSADVVCLSTDIRVGPLAPSACQAVELRFLALKKGVLALEAVRVVDLATQEHVDIKDLPTIVVVDESTSQ